MVIFSLNTIKRIPLERDESIQLFFEDYPKARGNPILFIRKRPIYGYWVFAGVPLAVVYCWLERFARLFSPTQRSPKHNPHENNI